MRFSKKFAAIAITAGVALTASAAFAFWTTSGSGSGSGSAAAGNGTLTLAADFTDGALFPGGSVPVSFTASNPGATDLQVGTIHAVITTSNALCLPADFSMADVVSGQVIPGGSTTPVALTASGSLVMANSGVNQDACKSATITLTLTS